MWIAYIGGYNPVIAFGKTIEEAERKVIKAKKARYKDDLDKWNWESVSDFYGAWCKKVDETEVTWL